MPSISRTAGDRHSDGFLFAPSEVKFINTWPPAEKQFDDIPRIQHSTDVLFSNPSPRKARVSHLIEVRRFFMQSKSYMAARRARVKQPAPYCLAQTLGSTSSQSTSSGDGIPSLEDLYYLETIDAIGRHYIDSSRLGACKLSRLSSPHSLASQRQQSNLCAAIALDQACISHAALRTQALDKLLISSRRTVTVYEL